MKVKVDPDLCQAYAICIEEAPEVFELKQDEDGFLCSVPRSDVIASEFEDKATKAMKCCPNNAISIED